MQRKFHVERTLSYGRCSPLPPLLPDRRLQKNPSDTRGRVARETSASSIAGLDDERVSRGPCVPRMRLNTKCRTGVRARKSGVPTRPDHRAGRIHACVSRETTAHRDMAQLAPSRKSARGLGRVRLPLARLAYAGVAAQASRCRFSSGRLHCVFRETPH